MSEPDPEVYDKELVFMPYRKSLRFVEDLVCAEAGFGASVLDLMCGTGYLLNQINKDRRDLNLVGVDIDRTNLDYAQRKYDTIPCITFRVGDVLRLEEKKEYDVVMCTGAMHHLEYRDQGDLPRKMASVAKQKGICIVSDCYVDDYNNEIERKLAAKRLGYEYSLETIKNGAPKEVVIECVNILGNDILGDEFKTSLKKRLLFFEGLFDDVQTFKTWPDHESEYGDYITVCRK